MFNSILTTDIRETPHNNYLPLNTWYSTFWKHLHVHTSPWMTCTHNHELGASPRAPLITVLMTLQFQHQLLLFLCCGVNACRSAGKVYHALIFHKGGQYSLDITGEEGTQSLFSSLDDLVVFCMSHQMKMEGDEVRGLYHLTYFSLYCLCSERKMKNTILCIQVVLCVCLQVTLKEVIHCENDLATNDDFPTSESNGELPATVHGWKLLACHYN